MKVWTVTYNDDNGSPNCSVHTNEQDAENDAAEWVSAYEDSYPNVDFNRPWREVFDNLTEQLGFMNSVTLQKHEVSLSEPTNPIEKAYIKAAQRLHTDDGVLEIDDASLISIGEDSGAYVQAWVWVPEEEIKDALSFQTKRLQT